MYPKSWRHLVWPGALAPSFSIISASKTWLSIHSAIRHGTRRVSGIIPRTTFWGRQYCLVTLLDHVIKSISNFCNKGVIAVELLTVNGNFLLISIYMPFYDASHRDEYLAEATDALSMVEILIDNHPQHHVIIGGYLNTQLRGDSPFDNMWQEISTKFQLAYCSNMFPSGQTWSTKTSRSFCC